MKQKGRVVLLLLCLATLLAGVFCFAACGGKTPSGKTDCEHEVVADAAVAATCETDGLTEGSHCSKCGEPIVAQQKVNKLGHDYKWTDVQALSCTTDGIREGVCSHDSSHITREVTPAAHTPVTDKAVSATCLTAGLTEGSHCAVCDAVIVKQEVVSALGHKIVEDTSKAVAPTCTTHGLKVQHCANPDCDLPEIQEQIPSSGHKWDYATRTCAHGQTCTVEECGAKLPALNHAYELDENSSVAVDCERDGEIVYVCSQNDCDDSYSVTIPKTGHKVSAWELVDSTEKPVAHDSVCEVEITYRGECTNESCSAEDHVVFKTETIERHTYKMTITTAATCEAESGVKTFRCEYCEASYTEKYTDENAHVWVAGETNNGVTLYTCTHHSSVTKKVVTVDESGTVDKSAIENGNELQLEHAAIKLDPEAVTNAGIETDVVITAEKKTADAFSNIPQELKDKIGDSPVFDFTMADASGNPIKNFGEVDSDGNLISGGKVTVTIPYELSEGEDPDCIEIWYIGDDGTPDYYKATYSNGFVSFETTHFSTYTVVRMSPLERCERYGHNDRMTEKAEVTCTTNGYERWACTRCGKTELRNQQSALGHDAQPVGEAVEATCTVQGTAEFACAHDGCNYGYTVVSAALGHEWKVVIGLGVDATCLKAGFARYKCNHEGCDEKYTQTLMQLQHNFKEEKTAPGCTTIGYSTFTCSACSYAYIGSFKDALGHKYVESVVAPTCTEDGYTLHACANCDSSYKTDITPKAHSWNIPTPTCGQGQKCLVCGENGLPATGAHEMENGVCKVCGAGCDHNFETTTVAATCTARGYTLKKCSVCKVEEKTDFTPALGHEGAAECVRCGASLLPDGFFKNALESVLKNQVAFKAENVTVVLGNMGEITVDFAEFFFRYDEANGLYAYGYGTYEMVQEDLPTAVTGYAQALIKDGMVYAKMQGPFGISENMFESALMTQNLIMPFEDLIGYLTDGSSSSPITKETVETVLAWLDEDFMPVIKTVEAFAGDELKGLVKKLTNSLVTIEKKSDGYAISYNVNAIAALHDNLYNYTVAENADIFLGEGGFEKIVDTVAKIADTTVQEILELAVRKGLKFKDLFAAADILVDKLMNAPGTDPEQKITLAMLVGQMMGGNGPVDPNDFITGADYQEIRNMTVLELVNAFMPSDPNPQPGPSIPDMPNPDVPAEKTLAEEGADNKITVAQITEMLGQIGGMNAYKMIAEFVFANEPDEDDLAEIKEAADEMLEGFLSSVTVKVNTSLNGAIENVSVVLEDFFAMKTGSGENDNLIVSGSLTITTEYESAQDYLAFETEQKNIYANIKLTEPVAKALFGQDVTFDFYGTGDNKTVKTVSGTGESQYVRIEGQIGYSDGYSSRYAYVQVRSATTKNYTISFAENLGITFAGDCGGWIKLQILGRVSYVTTTKIELSILDEEGNPIDVSKYPELAEQVKWYEEMYSKETGPYTGNYTDTYSLWYNTATHGYEVPKNDGIYEETKHNYVEVGTPIAPEGCTGWGETYYSCTDCGDSYTLYTRHGHYYRTFVSLKAGANSCFDGVYREYKCVFCGETSDYQMDFETPDPEYKHHYFGVVEVIDLSKYGIDERVVVYGCACGKSYEHDYYDYDSRGNVAITHNRGNEYQAEYVYNFEYGKDRVNSLRVYTFKNDFRIAVKLYMSETGCNVNCLITYECDENGENGKKIYEDAIGQYHTEAEFVVLDAGSKTCEDGYHYESRCLECGAVNRTHRDYYSHGYGIVEAIDLAPYGAKCGEKLLRRGCACGKYVDRLTEYNIRDYIYSSMQCDIESETIYYYGWDDCQYVYRCAVTEPECNLIFSVKVYTKENDCKVYMDIFACDEKGEPTNTPLTKTFVVGYNHHFTEVEGSRKPVDGHPCEYEYDIVCSVCNAKDTNRIMDHSQYDGRWQQSEHSPCEFVKICDGCGRHMDWKTEHDIRHLDPTCSQFGYDICNKCDYKYEIYPEHHWEWNEEVGMFVCTVCGLKNANGVNGSIILEEVSAQGEDMVVIGYAFRDWGADHQDYDRIGYEPVVAIKFAGEDGETDVRRVNVFVNRYNEEEGNYVSFFRSEVESAVAEQFGGEFGEYTICVTFVPLGAGMDLEYSIELD